MHRLAVPIEIEWSTLHGLRAARVCSPSLEVIILPGKGADLHAFRCRSTDTQMLAVSPHAAGAADTFRQGGAIGYGECFLGGWPSLLPSRARSGDVTIGPDRCGEAATVEWEAREAIVRGAFRLICSAHLPRSGLRVVRSFGFAPGGRRLDIRIGITNAADAPIEFHWTEHPTFGSALLADAFEFILPPCDVHDCYASRGEGVTSKRVTLDGGRPIDLRDLRLAAGAPDVFRTLRGPAPAWVAIFNPLRRVGVRLAWDARCLPNAWYWQSTRDGTRMLAIEPANSHRTELLDDPDGPPLRLAPGASLSTRMSLALIDANDAKTLRESLAPKSKSAEIVATGG